MTKQKWVVLLTAGSTILVIVGLGFAAMSTNPPFTVPLWLPTAFFSLAGLMTIALVAYLMWGLITRIPLRFQTPIIIINQQGKVNIASNITANKQPVPTRLTYDNVLWEDAGNYVSGGVMVHGPFCPKDLTPLATKRGWDKIVDTNLSEGDNFSDQGEHMFCLECKAEYVLSKNYKRLEQSRSEVRSLFEGIRRRKQEEGEG